MGKDTKPVCHKLLGTNIAGGLSRAFGLGLISVIVAVAVLPTFRDSLLVCPELLSSHVTGAWARTLFCLTNPLAMASQATGIILMIVGGICFLRELIARDGQGWKAVIQGAYVFLGWFIGDVISGFLDTSLYGEFRYSQVLPDLWGQYLSVITVALPLGLLVAGAMWVLRWALWGRN